MTFDFHPLSLLDWTRRVSLLLVLLGGSTVSAQEFTGGVPSTQTPRPPSTSSAPQAVYQFDVFEYVVDGNTVLGNAAIERAVTPFLGEKRSLQDVEGARTALEKLYQDAGFLTVSVELPEQRVNSGVVRLKVVEGSVERLRVSGAGYHLPSTIRAGVPSLAVGNVPQFSEVQEQLAALGRQPDRKLTPLLRPGKTPGKLEVELKVEDQLPLHASLEINNKQSVNTDTGRVESSVRYDNLFQRGHTIGLNWMVAPTNRDHADILTANYGVPFASGDYAYAFFTHSASDTPSGIGGSTVVKGNSFGARYRFNLPTRGGAFSHGFSAGLDFRDNKDDLNQNGLVVPRSLKYTAFAARYDHTRFDTGDGQTTTFDANLVFGLRNLNERTVDCDGTPTDQFPCKRFGAKGNFMVWRLSLDHRQPLGGDWNLRARADAQLASEPLVSQEQFGLGGSDSIRGYYEYEQFGDRGAALRLELGTPSIFWLGNVAFKGLGFAERGQVWLVGALPGEDVSTDLAGVGLGLRAESKNLSGRADYGVPLYTTSATTRHDGVWHLSLKLQF